MEKEFARRYKLLNTAQKQAVDTIEGPLLVRAGPGTGKTELLSLRVANILRSAAGVSPGNILCITFTDNAARNMRERLQSIIGQSAYHVSINTFHSFGSEVINQYPDHFTARRMLQQIDELGRYELLQDIFEQMDHSNPLSVKVGDDFIFLRDTLEIISWLKQNALSPDELREILKANQKFMNGLEKLVAEVFSASPSPKHLASYNKLLKQIQVRQSQSLNYGFVSLAKLCKEELEQAISETAADGRYAPSITAWRNSWCQKNADNLYVFKDGGRSLAKMQAVADAYEALIDSMSQKGLYDFDDMIVEVVHGLENDDELRYNLQERYQYVLVDEFQDTNKAQLRLLMALGDNPVNEGRPNIMAVGDDNQTIYAFQGAEASNMSAFMDLYKKPGLISLIDNYRSTPQILKASLVIADQITDTALALKSTELVARSAHQKQLFKHDVFNSELAQYDWLAEQINNYIKGGVKPEQIAVIAPRHRYLERLMPYLGQKHLPVAYERRENILDAPIILLLITMCELVVAISENAQDDVDTLLAQVLAYDFWQIKPETLLSISLEAYNKHVHWLSLLKDYKDKSIKEIINFFVDLAAHSQLEPLEYVLDKLVGGINDGNDSEYDELNVSNKSKQVAYSSPLRNYYFNEKVYETATDQYLTLLGQLSTLRQRLRGWKPTQALYVKDFIEFVQLHRSANLKIIDTNPHTQTTNAVQVMTVYKAKGLEFEVVFLINVQDEIWGPTARSRRSSISLPKNLPLAPNADSDNDKLRLFFVALTRAKHSLHLTSYSHTLENKLSPGLSFMIDNESQPLDPGFSEHLIDRPATAQAASILTTDWAYRFRQIIADKPSLFEPVLANYKLSVTHLNNFLDVAGSGPHYFLLHNLLRFPEAPTPSAAYGDAVHKTLQWAHLELRQNEVMPSIKAIGAYFIDILSRKQLRKSDHKRLEKRGLQALAFYFENRQPFSSKDILERGFNNEGVVISGANLSGKIDKLHFLSDGTVEVVDFKTGKPASSWQGKDDYEKIKLHKYRQQLLFYKLLVEHSASFSGKLVVSQGSLEFIETNETGKLVDNLALTISPEELARFSRLISAVWQHIMHLDFPDISNYPKNLGGIQQFERDIVDGQK